MSGKMSKKNKVPMCDSLKHPMQPIGFDGGGNEGQPYGIVRFKENKIVRFLLDAGPFDLNQISCMEFNREDYTQLMQLIGYSTSGYGELSTSPKKMVRKADAKAAKLWTKWVTNGAGKVQPEAEESSQES